ncbi:39S ribosomal protein L32, mitochondrial [Teleopsis dalmanni]|uniref:39S ribosomal protein L32, mitochondrial n=1 Tax=Teleopsis dalmanni TaxID=139649 RepID=UPI0018CC9289|nr:39S ribosomal protein L32, mitochondrial [Teleopsis dalmanni]
MSRYLVLRFKNILNHFERLLPQLFHQGGPPPALALAGMPSTHNGATWRTGSDSSEKFSLKDLIGDGILWAVPKHRRSIARRLQRKFGVPDLVWKPLKIKTHLRNCTECGHDYEAGVLCPHCYDKVRKETQLMQDKIQEQLGLSPVEQEVVVLYDGEKREQSTEYLNGKRIVEMEKPRPMWFSKNLIQKTTQQPADTKEVKPSDLG